MSTIRKFRNYRHADTRRAAGRPRPHLILACEAPIEDEEYNFTHEFFDPEARREAAQTREESPLDYALDCGLLPGGRPHRTDDPVLA